LAPASVGLGASPPGTGGADGCNNCGVWYGEPLPRLNTRQQQQAEATTSQKLACPGVRDGDMKSWTSRDIGHFHVCGGSRIGNRSCRMGLSCQTTDVRHRLRVVQARLLSKTRATLLAEPQKELSDRTGARCRIHTLRCRFGRFLVAGASACRATK